MEKNKYFIESSVLNFNKLVRELFAQGEKIYSLGLGEPCFKTPESIVEATIKALQDGKTRYSDSKGILPLREAISRKFYDDNRINASADRIFVTLGAKQAIVFALMAILEPFDEVINLCPCYVSYLPQISIAEPRAIVHNIDFDKVTHRIDLKTLNKCFNEKTKALLINFPNNPLGTTLHQSEADEIVRLVDSHPNCYVISDEVYEYLNYSNEPVISVGSYDNIKDRVFTVNGLSKAFSMTGWRVGYMHVPSTQTSALYRLCQHINTNVPTFIQYGAIEAINTGKDHLKEYLCGLRQKSDFLSFAFSKYGNHIPSTSAGLFTFLDISRKGLSSDDFATTLLKEFRVAVNPGVSFGGNWDDHIRISLSGDQKDFEIGVSRMAKFIFG